MQRSVLYKSGGIEFTNSIEEDAEGMMGLFHGCNQATLTWWCHYTGTRAKVGLPWHCL